VQGRNQALLDALSEIARSNPMCALVQRFNDVTYHRSNFTLGGRPEPVFDTAMKVIEEALRR
jgi:glutamate formiminotransferase